MERPHAAKEAAPARRGNHARWLLAGGVGQALLAFGANLVLVRQIAPEVFGRFALAYAAVTLVLSLGTLRIGSLAVRGPTLDAARRRLLTSALVWECLVGGILGLVWLLLENGLDGWTALLLGACLGKHLAQNARGFLEREGRWPQLARLEGLAHLLSHAVAVVLALTGFGLAALVLRELVLALVWIAALGLAGAFASALPRRVTVAQWQGLWGESKDLWLDGALEGAFARAMVLGAGFAGGERGAGLFAQAHRLAFVPHQLLSPLVSRLAFAWFSAESRRGALRRRIAMVAAGPLALCALLGALTAPWVVPALFGASWSEVAPLLQALSGVVLGISLLELCKMEFYARRDGLGLLRLRALQFGGLGLGLFFPLGFAAWSSTWLLCVGLSLGTLAALVASWWRLEQSAPQHDDSVAASLAAGDARV